MAGQIIGTGTKLIAVLSGQGFTSTPACPLSQVRRYILSAAVVEHAVVSPHTFASYGNVWLPCTNSLQEALAIEDAWVRARLSEHLAASVAYYIRHRAEPNERVRGQVVTDWSGIRGVQITYDHYDSNPPAYGQPPYDGPGTEDFWQVQPKLSRVRAKVSEDAGSILQATAVVPVESAVSEAFLPDVSLPKGSLRTFREYLHPDGGAVSYYPLPTRNLEYLGTYAGETKLGRMARVYPRPVLGRIADLPEFGTTTATAQEVINHIFTKWAGEFDWFTFEPVPDLRLLVSAAVGNERDYYLGNSEGVLRVEAIAIPQDDESRRTMREIIDEWLGIFPGTIIRQNSRGNIELVPRVGPDAPDDALSLSWRDIYDMSEGTDDPAGVTNRCRVESRGYEFLDEQQLNAPAYTLTAFFTEEAFEGTDHELPNARERTNEIDPNWFQRVYSYAQQRFVGLTSGDEIEIAYAASNFAAQGQNPYSGVTEFRLRSISSDTLRLTRASPRATVRQAGTVSWGLSSFNFWIDWVFTWEPGVGVTCVGYPNAQRVLWTAFAGTQRQENFAYLIEWDVFGSLWTRSIRTVIGEFGYDSNDLPGGVIGESLSAWGEREAVIRSSQVQLTAEQAQEVAQAYVLQNINPRTIREVEQSAWNKFPVQFDHIGRFVDLPNGERALVQNRAYQDAFDYRGGVMSSTFQAVVTEQLIEPGNYLFDERGSYLQDEDGVILEDEM